MPTASSGKRRAEHYWEGGSFSLGCHLLPSSPFLRRLESSLKRLNLIVIDGLGYLPMDRQSAEQLFVFLASAMNK